MASQTEPTDPIVAELTAIKRLLVCLLMRSGASQGDIGKALGIDRSNVSRMLSNGKTASGKPRPRRRR
jgi:predicted transcriptional regulator